MLKFEGCSASTNTISNLTVHHALEWGLVDTSQREFMASTCVGGWTPASAPNFNGIISYSNRRGGIITFKSTNKVVFSNMVVVDNPRGVALNSGGKDVEHVHILTNNV